MARTGIPTDEGVFDPRDTQTGDSSMESEPTEEDIRETIAGRTGGHGIGGGPTDQAGGSSGGRRGGGQASRGFGGTGGTSGGSGGDSASTQRDTTQDDTGGADRRTAGRDGGRLRPSDIINLTSGDPRFRGDIFRSPAQQEQFVEQFEQRLRRRFDDPTIVLGAGAVGFEKVDDRVRARVTGEDVFSLPGRGFDEAQSEVGQARTQGPTPVLSPGPGGTGIPADTSPSQAGPVPVFNPGVGDIGISTDVSRVRERTQSVFDPGPGGTGIPADRRRVGRDEKFGDFDFRIPETVFGVDVPGGGREPEALLRSARETFDERVTEPVQEAVGPRVGQITGAIAGEASERELLTPTATEAAVSPLSSSVPGVRSAARIAGEQFVELDREEAESIGSAVGEAEARGGVQGAADIVTFPLSAPVVTQEFAELSVEAVEEHEAGRGAEFRQELGAATVEVGKQALRSAKERPFETGGQLGGSLLVSGGLIGGASKISPALGRGVSVGIQPGEELAIAAARRGVISPRSATKVPGVRRGMVGGRDRGQLDLTFGGGRRRGTTRRITSEDIADIEATADVGEPTFLPGGRMGQRSPDPVAAGRTETGSFVGSFTRQQDPAFGGTGKPNVGKTRDFSQVFEGPEFTFGPRRSQTPELDPLTVRALEQTRRTEPAIVSASTGQNELQSDAVSPELDALADPTIGTEPSGGSTRLGETSLLGVGAGASSRLSADLDQQEVAISSVDQELDPLVREEIGTRARSDTRVDTRQDQLLEQEERIELGLETRQEVRLESQFEALFEPRGERRREIGIEPRTEARFEALSEPDVRRRRRGRRRVFETDIFEKSFADPTATPEEVVFTGSEELGI